MANPSASGQGLVRDERGQAQPADERRAQQSSSRAQRGERPVAAADDPTSGDEAQKRRDKMQRQEKAEGEAPRAFPDRDPATKKTGEF
jgi:hypothetical protein